MTDAEVEEKPGRTRVLYLGDHSNVKNPYGFRIYRATYGDDEKWERFMTYFKANVERTLSQDDRYKDQLPRVDYTVQSDVDLDGATVDQVRK